MRYAALYLLRLNTFHKISDTMVKFIALFFISCIFATYVRAQDTLPGFTVRNIGNNRVIISWINDFNVVKQVSIQRSHDSLKNYKTIATVPDPMAKENGFADVKAPNDHMFYRLFISLDKGSFVFSDAKKPVWDTARKQISTRIDKLPGNQVGVPNQGVNGTKPVDFYTIHVCVHAKGWLCSTQPS